MLMPDVNLLRSEALPGSTMVLSEAAHKLGVSHQTLYLWTRRGLILAQAGELRPGASGTQPYKVDSEYAERLLEQKGTWKLDIRFVELFALAWCINAGSELGLDAEAYRAQLKVLCAQGEVLTGGQAAARLGVKHYDLVAWRQRGFLRWVADRRRKWTYCLEADIAQAHQVRSALTAYEAAEQLDVTPHQVAAMARSGDLPSCRTITGELRFEQEALNAVLGLRAVSDGTQSLEEASTSLGVKTRALSDWARNGVLTRHYNWLGRLRLCRAEVEALRLELRSLNAGFEWLEEFVPLELPRRPQDWMAAKAAVRHLELSYRSQLVYWYTSGLVPAVRLAPASMGRRDYLFPVEYIKGLGQFARQHSKGPIASFEIAQQYQELCSGARRVM
jgi:predicted site-specific integrase-resolvase